ncbi:MAG: HEAT repeat domain-containing protein, partial [Acidobacteria bacterium]|nr:HEAT repeat domain-containing protein [Acidobacteriota bacterium]
MALRGSSLSAFSQAILAFIALALLAVAGCRQPSQELVPAGYTGRQACQPCHPQEYAAYTGSHHDLAMDPANDQTVLGDFEDATLTHLGVTSRFYRRDGRFLVSTEGGSGAVEEFEVKYTFGADPLQQYLVEFPGGRLQCLPLCWDSRPRKEGGQRWFHLYGNERIAPRDLLFWTRVSQNWNSACAECHSTGLRKNFDPSTETYRTRWIEVDVSCEACHGPGAAHVEWAEARARGEARPEIPDLGLAIRLKEAEPAAWTRDDSTGKPRRTPPLAAHTQAETCARCHSRRGLISEDYVHGASLLNTHNLSLLEEYLYYPDGQILEEVYVYGSFLQSRMAQEGVVCTDCHDAHSARLHQEGDALCTRCHAVATYASRSHHHHPSGSPGARCVECHMPARTYMVVDPRRDHSFRVPRPDLTAGLETPNACNHCHGDRSTQWSVEHFQRWYGAGPRDRHFGETLAEARKGIPGLAADLIRLAQAPHLPAIVRATAVSLLDNYPGESTAEALGQLAKDPSPLVRAAAVEALGSLPPHQREPLLQAALEDPVRLVRTLAGRFLAGPAPAGLSRRQRRLRASAVREYEEVQRLHADHPGGCLNLGDLYRDRRDLERAEASYRQAIALEPAFIPAYLNLADLCREMDREDEGKKLLLEALKIAPRSASAQHSLGLLLVRTGERRAALGHLAQAAELEPDNSRHAYVYGVALNS